MYGCFNLDNSTAVHCGSLIFTCFLLEKCPAIAAEIAAFATSSWSIFIIRTGVRLVVNHQSASIPICQRFQIDYSFPEIESDKIATIWRFLPHLSIPDGAHKTEEGNFDHEQEQIERCSPVGSVFFTIPTSVEHPFGGKRIFGISYYRQIDANVRKDKTKRLFMCTSSPDRKFHWKIEKRRDRLY